MCEGSFDVSWMCVAVELGLVVEMPCIDRPSRLAAVGFVMSCRPVALISGAV